MFLKLTQLNIYTNTTEEVYINPAHVTYMNRRQDQEVFQRPEKQGDPMQKRIISYTIISFVAGLREESDSITVVESPAEIFELMEQGRG